MGTLAKIGIAMSVALVGTVVAVCVWGFGLYSDEVCDHLKGSAVVIDRLGPPTSCDARMLDSGKISDVDTFIFALSGQRAAATPL